MAAFVTNQVTTRLRARAATAVGGAGGSGADGGDDEGGGSTTAALGTKWAHCVNKRRQGSATAPPRRRGAPSGSRAASRRRVIKVVKSPRCALVGFEYDVWAGGVRVDADARDPRAPLGRKRRRRHSKLSLQRKRVVTRADERRETRADERRERTSGRADERMSESGRGGGGSARRSRDDTRATR